MSQELSKQCSCRGCRNRPTDIFLKEQIDPHRSAGSRPGDPDFMTVVRYPRCPDHPMDHADRVIEVAHSKVAPYPPTNGSWRVLPGQYLWDYADDLVEGKRKTGTVKGMSRGWARVGLPGAGKVGHTTKANPNGYLRAPGGGNQQIRWEVVIVIPEERLQEETNELDFIVDTIRGMGSFEVRKSSYIAPSHEDYISGLAK